jgi:hypothetical protein
MVMSVEMKIDNLEGRMDKLERKVDDIHSDLKELIVSLKGNSIQEGLVVRTRKDIEALEEEMRHIRRNQLRDDQIASLEEIRQFFHGWQFFVGKVIVFLQVALGLWLTLKEITGN